MGLITIGSRLVRTFGEGKNLRKIVSECVDGKTYTRVLGEDGKILTDRVKMIERSTVGNKKISTITKVSKNSDDEVSKSVYNRVYNQEGQLLGSRNIWHPDITENSYHVSKQGNDYDQLSKFVEDGRVFFKSLRYNFPGRMHTYNNIEMSIHYNNKGLPRPYRLSGGHDMSLKEMRDWHLRNSPELPYAHPQLKLGFLDNRGTDNTLSLMNDLDKFI